MKYKAFTLVELIVIISILGILSTISFISYIGFTENSRDSARITNLTKLEKSLETRKAKVGEYPAPDESLDVTYLGKTIFTQGILGETSKKHLQFSSEDIDPKYDVDYTYSITADGKRFEIGTILEDGSNNTLGLFNTTYANEDDVAINHGNFNGKYYSTRINGETHIFTIPSITLKDKSGFDIVLDEVTENFSVTGVGALPESYIGISEADKTVSFKPTLLYKGPNCGVESDQEIVNFVANLRDSFNFEPFLSDNTYKSVFSDYEYLRNSIYDFQTLEEIGIKINESLGCDIKNFKTIDIFPTECGFERLNFEGVIDGFDIEDDSCLFEYEGIGSGVVKDDIGKDGTKGLLLDPGSRGSGNLYYRVFTYLPTKFNFDINADLPSNSYFSFYINDIEYFNSGDDLSFETYTTPLLPPGLYDFRWEVYRHNEGNIVLDNLVFTCLGGGVDCGWEDEFIEKGDNIPWELFDFTGSVELPWIMEENSRDDGIHILRSPALPFDSQAELEYQKSFNEPQKFSFDYKAIAGSFEGHIKFFINDIEYFQYPENITFHGFSMDEFENYTTPLLEAGDYTFKWRIDKGRSSNSYLELDDFKFTCIGGPDNTSELNCGTKEIGLDQGETPWWEIFDFTGSLELPWFFEENTREGGTHILRSPALPFDSQAELEYQKSFNEPQKFSFDYKAIAGSFGGNIKFFINDIEYFQYPENLTFRGFSMDEFENYTTPLLESGDYTFKWRIDKGRSSNSYLQLDNFDFICIGGPSNTSESGCGIQEIGLDQGETPWWDIFNFTGSVELPWAFEENTREGGTHILRSPTLPFDSQAELEYDYTFSGPQKFSFDYKAIAGSFGGHIKFFVNDIEYFQYPENLTFRGFSMDEFENYTTPILPAGDYKFKWRVDKGRSSNSYLQLDNFEFTCLGIPGTLGNEDCGWEALSLEKGLNYLSDLFDYTGIWIDTTSVRDDTDGNYAIVNSEMSGEHNISYLEFTEEFSEPKRISFYLKTDIEDWSNASFWIDGERKLFLRENTDKITYNSGYQKFTSDILTTGSHTFKWEINKRFYADAFLFLDDITYE